MDIHGWQMGQVGFSPTYNPCGNTKQPAFFQPMGPRMAKSITRLLLLSDLEASNPVDRQPGTFTARNAAMVQCSVAGLASVTSEPTLAMRIYHIYRSQVTSISKRKTLTALVETFLSQICVFKILQLGTDISGIAF